MKISRDWKAVVDYGREEGFKRGKERAIAKCAKGAKMHGVAMDIVIKATGLTEEQINNL